MRTSNAYLPEHKDLTDGSNSSKIKVIYFYSYAPWLLSSHFSCFVDNHFLLQKLWNGHIKPFGLCASLTIQLCCSKNFFMTLNIQTKFQFCAIYVQDYRNNYNFAINIMKFSYVHVENCYISPLKSISPMKALQVLQEIGIDLNAL